LTGRRYYRRRGTLQTHLLFLQVLLVLQEDSKLITSFVVFAVGALAIGGAEDARLETFAILFQAR